MGVKAGRPRSRSRMAMAIDPHWQRNRQRTGHERILAGEGGFGFWRIAQRWCCCGRFMTRGRRKRASRLADWAELGFSLVRWRFFPIQVMSLSDNLSSSGLGFNLVPLFFRCLGFRFLGFEEFARMMGISRIVCREFLRLVEESDRKRGFQVWWRSFFLL